MPLIKKTDLSRSSEKTIKIVQISDIHYKAKERKFDRMIAKINRLNPDIFFITGDLIDDNEQLESFIDCVDKLTIKGPRFAIIGNWEYWSKINIEYFKERLLEVGIVLLINENRIISVKDQIVQIYGLDDYLGGKPDFSILNVQNDQINIVLAHCPVLFDTIVGLENITNLQKVLVLSGHTHGGQITFFGLPIKKPNGSGKYTSGIYRNSNYILYVSKGIGNSIINLRLFSPPTIEVIEL